VILGFYTIYVPATLLSISVILSTPGLQELAITGKAERPKAAFVTVFQFKLNSRIPQITLEEHIKRSRAHCIWHTQICLHRGWIWIHESSTILAAHFLQTGIFPISYSYLPTTACLDGLLVPKHRILRQLLLYAGECIFVRSPMRKDHFVQSTLKYQCSRNHQVILFG
jgi:hypothetical protein